MTDRQDRATKPQTILIILLMLMGSGGWLLYATVGPAGNVEVGVKADDGCEELATECAKTRQKLRECEMALFGPDASREDQLDKKDASVHDRLVQTVIRTQKVPTK